MTDEDGNTLLHHAAKLGYTEIAEWLLHQGAAPKALNNANETPKQVAMQYSHTDLVNRIIHVTQWLKLQPHLAEIKQPLEQEISQLRKKVEQQNKTLLRYGKVFKSCAHNLSLFKERESVTPGKSTIEFFRN